MQYRSVLSPTVSMPFRDTIAVVVRTFYLATTAMNCEVSHVYYVVTEGPKGRLP
jgi:hypothetical protein